MCGFPEGPLTAVQPKMPLQPPKKTAAGYFVALAPPESTTLSYAEATWTAPTGDWARWATETRSRLLGELLSHGTWFSRPPRREILDPLFGAWVDPTGKQFVCTLPEVPGAAGSATVGLTGLMMSATAIEPVWQILDVHEEPQEDRISLFGDAATADDASSMGTREIELADIEPAPVAGTPTRIRSREWEARKFLAKERVREARLKAQIAARLAQKEESRFYSQYGDLEDAESRFSDYDLTDDETEASAGSQTEEELDAVEHV